MGEWPQCLGPWGGGYLSRPRQVLVSDATSTWNHGPATQGRDQVVGTQLASLALCLAITLKQTLHRAPLERGATLMVLRVATYTTRLLLGARTQGPRQHPNCPERAGGTESSAEIVTGLLSRTSAACAGQAPGERKPSAQGGWVEAERGALWLHTVLGRWREAELAWGHPGLSAGCLAHVPPGRWGRVEAGNSRRIRKAALAYSGGLG